MLSCESWWFWQKKQPQGQPVKKMVPEPWVPVMQGSSPLWATMAPMRSSAVWRQKPVWPARRLAPQRLGQSVQCA